MHEPFKKYVSMAVVSGMALTWTSGSEEAVKQSNNFGKGVASVFAANSSTSSIGGVTCEPTVMNTIAGSAHRVILPAEVQLGQLATDFTDGGVLFVRST